MIAGVYLQLLYWLETHEVCLRKSRCDYSYLFGLPKNCALFNAYGFSALLNPSFKYSYQETAARMSLFKSYISCVLHVAICVKACGLIKEEAGKTMHLK